jgi:hypothetical protein
MEDKDIIEATVTKLMETSSGPIMYYNLYVHMYNYNYYFQDRTSMLDYLNRFKKQRELLYRKKCKIDITYNEYYEPVWPSDYTTSKNKLSVPKFDMRALNNLS